jgi:hypothetical protein
VHRSFIVNLTRISAVERGRIVIDGSVFVSIGDQNRSAFQKYIDKNFAG